MTWSLAKAKDNLSEVIRRSRTEGPQEISIHGQDAAVVLSAEDFRRLKDPRASRDFKDWLLNGPSPTRCTRPTPASNNTGAGPAMA